MNATVRFELDPALHAACVESIRAGSKSFYAASLLLPSRVRLPARALYAFCRASDDLVDDGTANEGGVKSNAAKLRRRLNAVYSGTPGDAVEDRVFAKVVEAFSIPRSVPEALVEGFEWDEMGRTYETIDELCAYAARVASTVGIMMTLIMGGRERAVLARATDLGFAMQLTNIARDVGEDARRGRLYLPRQWMREHGIDPELWLLNPVHSKQLGLVVAKLLDYAAGFYDRALTGVGGLPLDCRAAIRSAAYIYRDIGREIMKANYNSVDTRAHTSKNRKIELIAMAAVTPFQFSPVLTAPTHPSGQFLVDASTSREPLAPRGLDAKAGRLIELMVLSEQRRRIADSL